MNPPCCYLLRFLLYVSHKIIQFQQLTTVLVQFGAIMNTEVTAMKQYEKIVNDIKQCIEQQLQPGSKLPSLNEMAKQYLVSKGTVLKAYETLEKQCLIFVKPQSGFYVAGGIIDENDKSDGYHLETGNPMVNSYLFQEMKQCLQTAAQMYSFKTLDLTIRGVDSLNEILPVYLAEDSIYARQENIYLIQGIMQMLSIFSHSPFPNHKETILIEDPSYNFYIRYLKQMKLSVKTIKRNEDGINLQELEHIFKNDDIKFFYTIPRHHNPLGTSYDHRTRKKIMELAIQYDVYIIEDDYFSHYYKLPKYLPLYYFSNRSHCIYLRSYTKIIPFIRIGIAVIPDHFIETMNQMTELSYYYSYHMPSLVSQAVLEAYIRSGLYRYQSEMIDKELQRKIKTVKQITASWSQSIAYLVGQPAGCYLTIRFAENIDSKRLVYLLKKEKIYVSSNQNSYYQGNNPEIRLSLSRISNKELPSVLSQIYHIINHLYLNKKI